MVHRKSLYFLGTGIAIAAALLLWSTFSQPRIEWIRLDNGINPNPYTQDWNTVPLSELEDSSSKRFLSLEEAQLELDEIHFEIKVPSRRTLPPDFSVVGVIYSPPSFHGPRGLIGASSPEKVILLLSDKPITMSMTKVEFDMSGGISFQHIAILPSRDLAMIRIISMSPPC